MNLETVHRAVLLTDIVDSTTHIKAGGDLIFARLMVRLEQAIRGLIREYRGREIDKTDGFLIVFEEPLDALGFALELQERVEELSKDQTRELKMRTGLHYGTLVLRQNTPEDVAEGAKSLDVDGLTKVIAARLTALAEPGQVLITRTLFDLVREDDQAAERVRSEALWLAHGTYLLQGLSDPVEIYEIGYPGKAPLVPPSDKSKTRRAILPQDEFALGWRPANGQNIPTASDFTVVRKLGEGGYGEVWLAVNKATGEQRVYKFCFDPLRMRSLNREKLLLTILQESLGDRDDIVQILDWNTHEAPYFIALAYIPTDNLLTYLDKRPSGKPLATHTVLTIIRKAAVALEAAHSVGVLHKDIKPSNLLISGDEDPVVYLIDFGIGFYNKPEDQTTSDSDPLVTPGSDHTTFRTSSFSGSRMYIAPEVIEGKMPTVQADLFSLGVLLYQLLRNDRETGLKVGWERDIEDPFLVDMIARATDGDLDKRLRSVSEFISRIDTLEQRRQETMAADADRNRRREAEKALEAQKRRRRFYVAALAIAIPLSLISVVLAYRSNQASKLADVKAREATVAREKGNALISFMLEDLTRELQQAGQLPLMDSVTSQTLGYYESESTSSLTNEELYNRARGFYNLGEIFFARNDMNQAGLSYKEASAIAVDLQKQNPASQHYAVLYSDATHGKAAVLYRMRSFTNLNDLYEEALSIRKRIYENDPANLDAASKYANSCHIVGYQYRATTGSQLAYEAIRVTNKMQAIVTAPGLGEFWTGVSYYSLARISPDTSVAYQAIHTAMSNFEKAQKLNPGNFQIKEHLLKAYAYYGKTYPFNPREQGFEKLKAGAEICAMLLNKDYTNLEWRRLSSKCLYEYQRQLWARGHYSEAVQYSRQAAGLLDEMILTNPNDHLLWDDYWGNRLYYQKSLGVLGDYDEQKIAIRETNKTIRQMLEKEHNLINYLRYYLFNSSEQAIIENDPGPLKDAIKLVKQIDTETTISFRGSLSNLIKSCELLSETPEAFARTPVQWDPSMPIGTTDTLSIRPFFMCVDNNTSEILHYRLFTSGSNQPFHASIIPGNGQTSQRVSVMTISDNTFGISINGSSIRPLTAIGQWRNNALHVETEAWLKGFESDTNFRVHYHK